MVLPPRPHAPRITNATLVSTAVAPDAVTSPFASPARVLAFACRAGCGACCIAPSITTPIPGMPDGKPAGVWCVQLLPDLRCALFGRPERPAVCQSLRPHPEMCGQDHDDALAYLDRLEIQTSPVPGGA